MARETREQLEISRSRHASAHSRYKSQAERLYDKLRLLENRIRNTIVVGEAVDPDDLYRLRQMVPNEPRKTLNEIRYGRRTTK